MTCYRKLPGYELAIFPTRLCSTRAPMNGSSAVFQAFSRMSPSGQCSSFPALQQTACSPRTTSMTHVEKLNRESKHMFLAVNRLLVFVAISEGHRQTVLAGWRPRHSKLGLQRSMECIKKLIKVNAKPFPRDSTARWPTEARGCCIGQTLPGNTEYNSPSPSQVNVFCYTEYSNSVHGGAHNQKVSCLPVGNGVMA